MQMQEYVGEHAQRPVAWRVVALVAEDGSVDLGLRGIFQTLDLFLCLGGNVSLEGVNILFHAAGHTLDQTDLAVFPVGAATSAVRAVRIVFVSHEFEVAFFLSLLTWRKPGKESAFYTPVKNAPGSLKCEGCPLGH